tara:strand:+ start:16 stop:1695 length:1680 start_codon:yes stop_codon:yes gene_type:complete
MSNTLRRKMFKLGGSANTHGIGITSGLKMNKGGRVGFQNAGMVNPNLRTPFFQFGPVMGSPGFDPRFASLEEQLRGIRGAANLGFSQMKLGAQDKLAEQTGGGILSALLAQGTEAPQPGTAAYANAMKQFFGEGSQIQPDVDYLRLVETEGSEMNPLDTFGIEVKKGSEILNELRQADEQREAISLDEDIASAEGRREAIEAMRASDRLSVNEDALLGGITSTLDREVKGAIPDRLQEAVEAAIPERVLNLSEPPDLSIPEREVRTEGDEQEPSVQTGVSDEEILEQVENLKKEEQKENYDEKYQLFQDILNRDREGERGQTLAKAITQGSLALMEGQGAESVQEALKAFAGEIEKGDARTRDLQDKAKVLAIQEIQKDPERKLAKEDLALRRDIAEQDIDLRKDALDVQKFSAETTRAYNEGRLALDSYINESANNIKEEQLDIQMQQLGIDQKYKEGIIDYYESKGDQEDLSTILDAAGGDPTQILPLTNALELQEKGVTTVAPLNQKRTGFNAESMQENVIYGDIDAITGNLFVIKKDDKVLTFPTYQAALDAMTQ